MMTPRQIRCRHYKRLHPQRRVFAMSLALGGNLSEESLKKFSSISKPRVTLRRTSYRALSIGALGGLSFSSIVAKTKSLSPQVRGTFR